MIEEVVNSILEAEDVAQKRIDAAKLTADDIVSAAEQEADNFKKQTSASNKENFAAGVRDIEQQSTQNADRMLKELNAQADKEMEKYEKNVDKAVKIIFEQLI